MIQQQQTSLFFLTPPDDGMGPDHSSCRPERWLQMFASEIPVDPNDPMSVYKACNFIVACPTEPANYFHLLRRQLTWPFRRPLVVLSPKRTLRNPRATSPISAFVSDGIQDYFSCVIDDPFWDEKKGQAKGVLLCSGEIYYDLVKIREQNEGLSDVAFVRLEQLAPFPAKELNRVVASYPNIKACAWAQEEPANNGAATFLRDQLFYKETVQGLHMLPLTWISRPESASAASGDPQKHSQSQQQLLRTIVEWSNLLE
jgi:2-oxoglutarate dehydrogenase E1 component